MLPTKLRAQEPPMSTVTVTGQKADVVKKVDKLVHEVSNSVRAANGTAQDVLQSLPQVAVMADGKISVTGNAQVTILIDGKPTAMMSGDQQVVGLQTMSGADIASVEVITNPSAAYNANGGAIINIVLKRDRKPGARAQIRGSAADEGLRNLAVSGDMTQGDLSLHGNLADRRDGNLKIRQSTVDWQNPANGAAGQEIQNSTVFVRRHVESAALGLDYALSDSDNLSLSGRYNTRRSKPLFDVLNQSRDSFGERIFHRISYGPNEQSDSSVNLNYSRQTNSSALKLMLQRSNTIALIDKSYKDVYLAPARDTDYARGATRSARQLTQMSLDWSQPSELGQWGMGLDLQDKVDNMHNYQAAVDPLTSAELVDATTTNRYTVKTRLSAIYLTNRMKSENWDVLFGGRAESMALGVNPQQEGARTSHWQALNPSLNLMHTINDTSNLTLSFRRSLQMPDPRDLNPFTTYVDAQNLSRGNPSLKPQILNAWEIGTDLERGHLNSSLSAVYRTSHDTVIDARSFTDRILVTSKQNGGRARSAGLTGSLDWKPDKQLQLGVDGGMFRTMLYTPDISVFVRQDKISGYVNMRAAYSWTHNTLSLDAHALSAGITPLGRVGASNNVNLSWKHQWSKTLSLTLNANDIFDGSKRSYVTSTSTFRQGGFDHFVARRIYVGFVKKLE